MTPYLHHIAIVGCGFTGASALHQLVERNFSRRVTVFEKSGDFGPGYAYDPAENRNYLLNNTTDSLCLDPDYRRAFLDWLEEKSFPGVDLSSKGNVARALYGLFLRDAVKAAARKAKANGIEVEFVSDEVTQVREHDGQVVLNWNGGKTSVDRVIMATGRCPEIEFYETPNEKVSARYINSHILNDDIDTIPRDETVIVVGASLSAYDIINRLFAPDTGCRFFRNPNGELIFERGSNARKVILASRSGRLKKMQSLHPAEVPTNAFDALVTNFRQTGQKVSIECVGRAIWSDHGPKVCGLALDDIATPYSGCESAASVNIKAGYLLAQDLSVAKSKDAQNRFVDFFAQEQIQIWDLFAEKGLKADGEKAYRERFETATLAYAAPCPISTGERLLGLHRAGALEIVTGAKLPKLVEEGGLFKLEHAHGNVRASTLINATGAVDRDVLSQDQPAWVRDLVDQGLLRSYTLNGRNMPGAEIDLTTYRPPKSQLIYFANMMLWGVGFFTSSALTMATIISQIFDQIRSELEA